MSSSVSQKAANVMPAAGPTINVWDTQTFDAKLLAQLEANADLISDYFEKNHQVFLSYDLGRGPERSILRCPRRP